MDGQRQMTKVKMKEIGRTVEGRGRATEWERKVEMKLDIVGFLTVDNVAMRCDLICCTSSGSKGPSLI